MTLRQKIESILSQIQELEAHPSPDKKLPQNTFYLGERDIVCYPRENGESRYPYDADGLVVWARSSGYIEACESTFNIFQTVHFSEDPSVNFFAGIPMDSGDYYPISLLGASRQLFEPLAVNRYVVYSPRCAYYITDTEQVTFAVRLHTDKKKHIHFALTAINKTQNKIPFYLASYHYAILKFEETEAFWDRMNKFGSRLCENSSLLRTSEHCLLINTCSDGGTITDVYYTMAKSDFLGYRGRGLTNAEALRTGHFQKQAREATTTEIPAACDMIHMELDGDEMVRREYDLSYYHSIDDAKSHAKDPIDTASIDSALFAWEEEECRDLDNMKITFADWNGKTDLHPAVLNRFIRNVQKQTSFCALGKNYAGPHIGIRDVFQQLEGSLIWQPALSREKIVVALNYILEDGRPPRQFSVPATPDTLPDMDMREYIDQGVWIISTIYTYLSYTDDYSILDEICSYYVAHPDHNYVMQKSDIQDTVLEHLLRIMDFLAGNLDREYGTNCLRALYGDWNDALDGLGKTKDSGKKYGSGVTVMATLQFYQNLQEMTKILTKIGKYTEKISEYAAYSHGIEEGLKKYGIDVNDAGQRRIIHGWGDKISYKLGSWKDVDGKSRRSITSNAFWAITGMTQKDPSMKAVIMDTLDAMDSKYGLKTFDVPFPYALPEAGRISYITPGTYENSCAYVHASMFGIMALFCLGESEKAWMQMEKSMVITHDNCTMTTFAMPNSYCENPDYEIDGGSMGDWYTGSGAVLVKEMIKYGFGIAPTLDGLTIQTPAVMPCKAAKIEISVKGRPLTLSYRNEERGTRTFTINKETAEGVFDSLMQTQKLFIPTEKLTDHMCIEVID